MRTRFTLALALASAAVLLTACGGGEPAHDICTVHRAAWIATPDGDIPLTGYEHRGLTDSELQEVGVIHARQLGMNPAAVVVGLYAYCEE